MDRPPRARLDRLLSFGAGQPASARLLAASATLLVVVLALDCAWQRVFIPRLMGLQPGAGDVAAAILPSADRKRLASVDRRRDAEYYLGDYRWHRGEYPLSHEVYSVRVGDASIMTVYDLRFDRR